MTIRHTFSSELAVSDGPSLSVTQTIPIDTYDLFDVTVLDGANEMVVQVQPGSGAAQVLLPVPASQYDTALSYKINSSGNPEHVLVRALLLTGSRAVGLLGAAPESLLFKNRTGSDV